MKYDPVKNIFARLIERYPLIRKAFYFALDYLILRQSYVKNLILKYFPKDKSFVFYDAGAGFCQYSDFIMSRYQNAEIIAMDLKTDYMDSYHRYRSIKKDKSLQIYQGDLQHFVCPKNQDLTIAIDILEHIEDDIAVLKNIYESSNQNALLIISTPSNLDPAAAFTEEHVRPGYDINELRSKLESSGFKIIELKYSYGFWGRIDWLFTMKFPLTLIGISKIFMLVLPLYYFIGIPFHLSMMLLDMITHNKKGNGIICVAQKG